MPERFGKSKSVYRYFLRACRSGLWSDILQSIVAAHPDPERILMIDATHVKAHQDAVRHGADPEKEGFGKTKGGRNSKLNAVGDSLGRLVGMKLMAGNTHEVTNVAEVLGDVDGHLILADKGYDSDGLIDQILEAGGSPNIPPRSNRKHPLPYDKKLGKIRHRVENLFCRLKRRRRVATRYDKLSITFPGFVILSAIDDWIRNQFVTTA